MLADNDTLQLSWSQVDEWEAEIARLQQRIAAAKVLLPARIGGGHKRAAGATMTLTATPEANFMGTVVEIANSVQEPISKDEMRKRLRELGFGKDKLGTPLNVTLYKTKKAGRISFENGMIGRAPK